MFKAGYAYLLTYLLTHRLTASFFATIKLNNGDMVNVGHKDNYILCPAFF